MLPNIIAHIPILIPIVKSNISPKIIANGNANLLFVNKPITKTNITNKFGFTPAILNQLKKFDCKKYIITNIMNSTTIVNVFFKVAYSSLFNN